MDEKTLDRHARNAVPESDIGIVYRKPIELFGRCSLEPHARFAHETIEEHQKPVELRHRRSWHGSGDISGCEFGCKGHFLSPTVYWCLACHGGLGRLSLYGLQERPGSFQRQTISIGVYRLGDEIRVKGPCALAVAGSLGRLRGSVEAPEPAGLISEIRFESLQRLLRSITLQQHLSKQLARGDNGTRNDGISFDRILAVGGGPQHLQCFFLLALRMGDPGGYHLAMDVDLPQPVFLKASPSALTKSARSSCSRARSLLAVVASPVRAAPSACANTRTASACGNRLHG